MADGNLELVRRGLEKFSETGEIDSTTINDEIKITDHDIPDQRGYRGHEGFAQ
jgi:hypothetical protein